MLVTGAFIVFSLAIAYILAGYPVLLGLTARYFARPVRKGELEPSISVIIPVFNGEHLLADKLRSVLAVDYPRSKMEIVVVSDGSTDSTDAVAESFAGEGIRLLRVPRGGKPAALNASIPTVSGEILLLTDVRQALAPDSVRRLMNCFADPEVGVVSGELIILSGKSREEAQIGLYWRFETWMRDQLGLVDSMFGATGPFYAIRRDLAVKIPPDMLLDDVYLPLSAFFRGYRLVMENKAKAYDTPTSLETEFRRKVRTLAGNYQILVAYPRLLGWGNRMWWHFVSYKVGRLLLPWLLIGVAVTSWGLEEPWRSLVLLGQLLAYGLAALDGWIGPGSPLKRISSPLRTFVTMMVAAVQGLSVFFIPAQSLWKVTSESKFKK